MKSPYFLIFLSVSLIVSLSSCVAGGSVSNVEAKIIGTWEFDEVKFHKEGKFSYSDYSDGFQGSSITFKEGGILEAYDQDLDTLASGFWYIDYYEEYDDEGDTKKTIYYMVGTLDIPELEIYENLLWDELSVSNKKLNAVEKEKNGGDYLYRLYR